VVGLQKERFPSKRKNKLLVRGDGPHKVRENAYKTELLGDMQVSNTFNVRDLTPYFEDDEEHNEDLRANPLQRVRLLRSRSRDWTYSAKKGF